MPWNTIIIVTLSLTFMLLVMLLVMAWCSYRKPIVSGQHVLIGQYGKVQLDHDGCLWLWLSGERWQCCCKQALQTGQTVQVKAIDGLMLVVKPGDRPVSEFLT